MTLPPERLETLLRYRWVIFASAVFNGALLSFHYAWGATLSGYHDAAWSLDAGGLGLLAALGFLPYALMQIPGGYLTDRFGVRKVMSVAVAAMALGTALFAGAPTFAVAAIARVVLGLGSSLILLPSLKLLSRWFRAREFATIQGLYLLLSTSGSVSATLPLALAAERWGWRLPMFAVATLTAAAAAVSWLLLRDDPQALGLLAIDARTPEAPGVPPRAPSPSLANGFRAWIEVPTFWASSIIFFVTYGSIQAFQGLWAGPVLRQVRGLTTTEAGRTLIFFTLGVAIGPLLFGFLSDRIVRARKPVVVFCVLSETLVWILIVATMDRLPVVWLNVVFFAVSALAGGVLVAQVMIAELCPPEMFGTVFGIVNGWAFYGTAAFQLLAGLILGAVGPVAPDQPIYPVRAYQLAFYPIVGLMVMASLLSLRLGETLGTRRGPRGHASGRLRPG